MVRILSQRFVEPPTAREKFQIVLDKLHVAVLEYMKLIQFPRHMQKEMFL